MREPIESIVGGERNEIIEHMHWDRYLNEVAMNPSTIKHGRKSMLHLLNAWSTESKETPALVWGRAVHTLCLEGDTFADRYAIWRHGRRSGSEWNDFKAEAIDDGKEILTQDEFASACAAGERCAAQSKVKQELGPSGAAEVTVMTVENGLQCKGRIDWVNLHSEGIVDLKTTRNIDSRKFGNDFFKFGYDISLGLYQRWLQSLRNHDEPVSVICIENVPPYDCTVVPIPDEVLRAGADKGLRILEQLAEAIEKNEWPGVDGGADTYELFVPYHEMEETENYDDE
jgi:hypothetical protein